MNSASSSTVEVIVPCYRYAHLLRDCVGSVLDQAGVNVRVLIIDDASPDDTESLARELMARDHRVAYRKHAKNLGHIATYNEGIDWLSADYALLLSADDMLAPGALLRACRVLDQHPEVGLTYGAEIKGESFTLRECDAVDDSPARVMSGDDFLAYICEQADNIVPTPTAIVRTSVQRKIGGYRRDLPHTADLEMWLRFAAHGSVAIIPQVQGFYRVHQQNMSRQYAGVPDLRQRLAAFEELFNRYQPQLRDVNALRCVLQKSLAQQVCWTASHCFDAGQLNRCREYLAFAVEVWPGLQATRQWQRLRCKQYLGSRVWRMLRPLVRRARRQPVRELVTN